VKVGLEVHQQLATGKLFCRCPSELSDRTDGSFARRLRSAQGEDRAVDPAAAFEASLGRTYRYETGPVDCLVEMDEEPPRALSDEALDVALTLALLLGARPVDEVEVMRKIVVDGSNTSGFQRTALVAVGGTLEVGGRRHAILSICLEEDAARKVRESPTEVVYRLDRLGIPLVEVATGPDIRSGPEAREVAEEIGALLRATGRARRGIGVTREDLNVSVEGGHRTEIKGVQELRKIAEYVDGEEVRQRTLLAVRDQLRLRGAKVSPGPYSDVAPLLDGVASGPLAAASRKGGPVLALALPGFAGLLGPMPGTEERLGRELADQARAVGLRGLIHSDELPGYGVAAPDVERIRRRLDLGERDAFVLVADASAERSERALRRIEARARAALEGIPGETRDPLPDGTTRYSRPLPGRHRMYPETDTPPIPITPERLDRLRRALPERPSARLDRLASEPGLSREFARQLVYGGYADAFETLARRGHAPSLVARLLVQDVPALPARGDSGAFEPTAEQLDEILRAANAGRIGKEGIPRVLEALARGASGVDAAIACTGLEGLSSEALAALVDRIVRDHLPMVRARGKEAFSPLMGDVMREVRGRRDGQEVAEALRRAIGTALEGNSSGSPGSPGGGG
jgi:glutamyl-tRNA(Gln) amidotransferase subunit E